MTSEFFEVPAVPGRLANLRIEILFCDQSGLIAEEQRRLSDEMVYFVACRFPFGRDLCRRDAVVEIHQHFPQIENNNLRLCLAHFSSRLPSSARLRVSSSANSRPLPAGKPWAMREIARPGRARRLAR